ncbi:MAG: response regulator [bacterium]|nr:response regulator [bacterium]
MSHDFSLQCYLAAQQDARISRHQYADLESLVHRLGLVDSVVGVDPPRQFTFQSHVPDILLVDDEPAIVEVWHLNLVERGYPDEAIHVFTSGDAAVTYVQSHSFGICLLDVQLRSLYSIRGEYISGIRVLRTMKDLYPAAKVILISGFVTYAMVKEAILGLGASYYLRKPCQVDDIGNIVQWAVDQLQS